MAASINTARALLKAGNTQGARRIAHEALNANPDDARAWDLLIDLERDAGNFRKSLELAEQYLEKNPDHIGARQSELLALILLGKKTRARKAIARLEEDFPYARTAIAQAKLLMESRFGSDRRAAAKYKQMRENGDIDDPMAEARLRSNAFDFFGARKVLLGILKDDPGGREVNREMAFNEFILARPFAARRHADIALRERPTDVSLRWLRKLTWFSLFPPIYFYHLFILAMALLLMRLHFLIVVVIFLIFSSWIFIPLRAMDDIAVALLGPYGDTALTVIVYGYFITMLLAVTGIADKIARRTRSVTLKKY